MLYLAVLRAGHVYLPLNNAYQAAELAYFIGNAEPTVFVCASRHFGWVSKLAFQSSVLTLDEDRTGAQLPSKPPAKVPSRRKSRVPRPAVASKKFGPLLPTRPSAHGRTPRFCARAVIRLM